MARRRKVERPEFDSRNPRNLDGLDVLGLDDVVDITPPRDQGFRQSPPQGRAVAGYTLLRSGAIMDASGEIVARHEINHDNHFDNFCAKFARDPDYRAEVLR